jgi:hypothetical protein
MHVRSTATIALEGWPPPTIEIQTLIAALRDCGHDSPAGPATAFQHLNELDISFGFELPEGCRADSRAQQIVHAAMARLYVGPIHVHVNVDGVDEPYELDELDEMPEPPTVIDLTAEGPAEPPRLQLFCAATGCERAAAAYSVSVVTVHETATDLELTMHLCAWHAESLGERVHAQIRS